jgi:DNA-binding XRE family transcriptional regulator
MTQNEMARYFGVNRNTIHLWEAHGIRPSIGVLIQMSDMFALPLSEIVRQADSPCLVRRPRRGRPRHAADQALRVHGEDDKMKTGCNGASGVHTETGGSRA